MAKAKAKAKSKAVVKAKSKKPAPKVQKAKSKLVSKSKAKPVAKAAGKKGNAKPAVKSLTQSAPAKPAGKTVATKKQTSSKNSVLDISGFVTPLDDRMIVQVSVGEKITAGGLYIPDTVSNVSGHREGIVLSVGRGHRDNKGRIRPMDVKQGDKVVFSDFTGSKIQYQGQDLIILRETDVMGVLDKGN